MIDSIRINKKTRQNLQKLRMPHYLKDVAKHTQNNNTQKHNKT